MEQREIQEINLAIHKEGGQGEGIKKKTWKRQLNRNIIYLNNYLLKYIFIKNII